jgi:hypothetical protein
LKLSVAFLASLTLSCAAETALPSGTARMTTNTCVGSKDCPGGTCEASICRASSQPFSTALFEVSFPANGPDAPGVRYFFERELASEGGALELKTGALVRLNGSVRGQLSSEQLGSGCTLSFEESTGGVSLVAAVDGSIPARLTLIPADRHFGLDTQAFSARAVSTEPGAGYQFSVLVPPGSYDIAVQPLPPSALGCALGPVSLRRTLEVDTTLTVMLPPPESLRVEVVYEPEGCSFAECAGLEGWAAELMDAESGRPLSGRVALGTPEVVGARLRYLLTLQVGASADGLAEAVRQMLRLVPPEQVLAPELYVDRMALELFEKGRGVIDGLTALPAAVQVEGRVEGALEQGQAAQPSAATLTFVASELRWVPKGRVARFTRSVDTDSEGRFQATLLPGVYQVQVLPYADSAFAASEGLLSVGDAPRQTGKVLEVSPKATLRGKLLKWSEEAGAENLPVNVVPGLQRATIPFLERLSGKFPLTPRGGITQSDAQGAFALGVDPGRYDISVRPPGSTRLAWLVRPQLALERPGLDLEQMRLPLPVVFEGEAQGAAGAASGALVRVYFYLDAGSAYTASASSAVGVVQVAEARADDTGKFQLLIPVKLH